MLTDAELLRAYLENRDISEPPKLPLKTTPFSVQAKIGIKIFLQV